MNEEIGDRLLDLVRRFEDRVLRRMLNQVPRIMVERADRESGWFLADGLQQLVATVGALMLLYITLPLVLPYAAL